MAKIQKSGLHKKISAIFDGVPVPNGNGNNESAVPSTSAGATGHIPPEKPAQSFSGVSRDVGSGSVQPSAPLPPKHKKFDQEAPVSVKTSVRFTDSARKNFAGGLDKVWVQVKERILTPPAGVSPSKHITMVTLMPVLILVAIFVFGRPFLGSGGKGNKQQKELFSPASAVAKKDIEWLKPAPYPDDLRDPMKECTIQTTALVGRGDIVVRGIVWTEDNPAAVIGTEIIYRGETFEGARVINITKESVEFERDGERWTQKIAGY